MIKQQDLAQILRDLAGKMESGEASVEDFSVESEVVEDHPEGSPYRRRIPTGRKFLRLTFRTQGGIARAQSNGSE